jgi:predicted secreted protein
MAGNVGRLDLLKKNNIVIAGVREKSISWAGEVIDSTSGEDNGFRRLIDDAGQDAYGQVQLSISFSGLVKESANNIRLIALNPALSGVLDDITYEFANGDRISGDVILSSYEESGSYKDASTFSAQLEFTGLWVYTPAP